MSTSSDIQSRICVNVVPGTPRTLRVERVKFSDPRLRIKGIRSVHAYNTDEQPVDKEGSTTSPEATNVHVLELWAMGCGFQRRRETREVRAKMVTYY